MKTISLIVNSQKIRAHEGESLLWAALDNGIYIPNLCALRDKPEPSAACRLCFVEIEGYNDPVTACTAPVSEGMVVNTRGDRSLALVRTGFELLMASHPVVCATCPANRACELQNIAVSLGVKLNTKRYKKLVRELPIDRSNPLFTYDPNMCVLCGRCVWVCQKHSTGVFGFAHRGSQRMVTTFGDAPMGESGCYDCCECVSVCPTGALSPHPISRLESGR